MVNGTAPAAPLTPAVFAILLSLAEGEKTGSPSTGRGRWGGKHGYLIMKDARAPQGGGVHLGPGTLYGSLERMMRDSLVEETGVSDDERRRYYRLTKLGHKVLAVELNRLDATVASARSLGLIPHGGRS
jgi:DNA-binding MarR family transcriptional regulator